jgi:hypothetical protein
MLYDQAGRSGSNRTENLGRFPKFLVLSAAIGVLTACMAPMQMSAPPPMPMMPSQAAAPAAPILRPTPGLAARERFQLAINQLQQGDSTHAAVELKAYLVDVPNSTPAKNLLAQIETPIETLYPADNFAFGQSLVNAGAVTGRPLFSQPLSAPMSVAGRDGVMRTVGAFTIEVDRFLNP